MKIILTEREKENMCEVLDQVGRLFNDSEHVEEIEEMKTKLDNLEIEETEFVEFCLRTNFMLKETEDAAKKLDMAYSGMKREWSPLLIKVYGAVSKVFLLRNTWTRNFFNATQYYVAKFKEAYDKMLLENFTVPKDPKEIRPSVDGNCIGGSCHQCTEYEDCPTGQMSEY